MSAPSEGRRCAIGRKLRGREAAPRRPRSRAPGRVGVALRQQAARVGRLPEPGRCAARIGGDKSGDGAPCADDECEGRRAEGADEQRARAEKNEKVLKDKTAAVEEKATAALEAKQKADAHGGDAKAKARLDKQATAAEKAAADLNVVVLPLDVADPASWRSFATSA